MRLPISDEYKLSSYLAPLLRYSVRYIRLPLLCLTPRRRGSPGTISVKFYLHVSSSRAIKMKLLTRTPKMRKRYMQHDVEFTICLPLQCRSQFSGANQHIQQFCWPMPVGLNAAYYMSVIPIPMLSVSATSLYNAVLQFCTINNDSNLAYLFAVPQTA